MADKHLNLSFVAKLKFMVVPTGQGQPAYNCHKHKLGPSLDVRVPKVLVNSGAKKLV